MGDGYDTQTPTKVYIVDKTENNPATIAGHPTVSVPPAACCSFSCFCGCTGAAFRSWGGNGLDEFESSSYLASYGNSTALRRWIAQEVAIMETVRSAGKLFWADQSVALFFHVSLRTRLFQQEFRIAKYCSKGY